MTNRIPYTLTNENVTFVLKGKSHTVAVGAPNFKPVRSALLNEEWGEVEKHLTVAKSLKNFLFKGFGEEGAAITFKGQSLPNEMSARIRAMAAAGKDPIALLNFYANLQLNPSHRSVKQLFAFLKHNNIPLTDDGHFLAYKSVKQDYKDHHSSLFDNRPGTVNEMPRNAISDDPRVPCDEGFHVGALGYAQGFHGGARIVICKVDPQDVVCVPYDESAQKVRVCKYKVVGNKGDALPSTTWDEALPVDERDPDDYEEHIERPREDKPDQVSKQSKPKKRSKEFQKFDRMDAAKLMEQTIGDLRDYAFKGLEIVGASKIPGGKTALISRILSVRQEK